MDNVNWEENFFDELIPCSKLPLNCQDDADSSDDDQDHGNADESLLIIPASKIVSY